METLSNGHKLNFRSSWWKKSWDIMPPILSKPTSNHLYSKHLIYPLSHAASAAWPNCIVPNLVTYLLSLMLIRSWIIFKVCPEFLYPQRNPSLCFFLAKNVQTPVKLWKANKWWPNLPVLWISNWKWQLWFVQLTKIFWCFLCTSPCDNKRCLPKAMYEIWFLFFYFARFFHNQVQI